MSLDDCYGCVIKTFIITILIIFLIIIGIIKFNNQVEKVELRELEWCKERGFTFREYIVRRTGNEGLFNCVKIENETMIKKEVTWSYKDKKYYWLEVNPKE